MLYELGYPDGQIMFLSVSELTNKKFLAQSQDKVLRCAKISCLIFPCQLVGKKNVVHHLNDTIGLNDVSNGDHCRATLFIRQHNLAILHGGRKHSA